MLIRDRFLRAITVFGVALFGITELLSAFHLIARLPMVVCWIVVVLVSVGFARRQRRPGSLRFDPIVVICALAITIILALTGITAAFSPPNSADAMAYHMPRVVYWAEQSSVRFFPTQYLNQIMLQPLAEYMMLHLFVVSGGDGLVNFVQWFASLASIVGVSSVAGLLGAQARGQALAALFCATLPSGVLASSGAKNDYWMAMWLVAAVYFTVRFTRDGSKKESLFAGGALGCALLTKATAYLFGPCILAAIFVAERRIPLKRRAAGAVIALACALAINAPHYARNYGLSGSILGFDSAQGDGYYRWRNETFGWRQTVSNVLRNGSEQLGARSDGWNQGVYRFVTSVHQTLAIDVDDPATTFRGALFGPPKNANHEADAPNRWHLMLLLFSGCVLAWKRSRGLPVFYLLGLICGFLVFCAYLKWQLFLARLLLPLFVIGAPLVGLAVSELKLSGLLQLGLCLFLMDNARLPVLENWVRPLRGPHSVLHRPREAQYFADLTQWDNEPSYRKTADLLARTSCRTIGIDISNLQLEYPLIALLRARSPSSVFLHTGVENPSARYRQTVGADPCAVVCLDCVGDGRRTSLYGGFQRSVSVDKFVVFLRE